MIIKKSREYYQQKASINKKANQSTAYKIQVYNNNRVDELVKRYNEGEAYTGTPESVLYAELAILNKPEVYKNYNHIIRSKFTSNDNIDNLNVKNKANRELDRIVSAEVERVSKNLQYVEQVLQKYTIPQKQYEEFKAKQEQSSIANRQQILKEVAVKANDLLVSDGLNIPKVYTYRNIETTAENLLRQSQMGSKHEEILAINNNYKNQGKDEIYTGKEWIWTGRGKTTRHRSNHLQKRQLKEPFIIVNDKTLHIDEMMYPSDPAGSFSNAWICYCECQYLTGDARDYQYLGSLNLNQTQYKVKNPILTPKEHKKPTLKNPVPLKLNGHHIEYTETLKDGSELKVYEFENGFTIGIAEGSPVTHEQVINHILSLPEPLLNKIKLKRINFYNGEDTKGGYSKILKNIMLSNSSTESVSTILDNLTHELAHAFDHQYTESEYATLSAPEVYDKIFIADNELGMKFVNPETGEVFYPERFPTDYAKTSWHKFKKMYKEKVEAWKVSTKKAPEVIENKKYSEDFADSTKLYLNPETHDKFVKEFPNRAKYLESLYGKPKFNVAPALETPKFMGAKQFKKQFNKPSPVKISQPVATNIQDYMNVNVGTSTPSLIDDSVDGVTSVPHNYLIDGSKVPVIYDTENGKYYYNGLELKEYDVQSQIGKVSKSAVTKHNNNITESTTTVTAPVPVTAEFIDMFELGKGLNGYDIFDFDGVDEINGKYYYKGLDISSYYDVENGYALDIPEELIEAHNKQFKSVTDEKVVLPPQHDNKLNNELVTGEPIDTDHHTLMYMDDDNVYTVMKSNLTEINDKFYYKGLDVTDYMSYNNIYADIPKEVVDKHNQQFGIEPNTKHIPDIQINNEPINTADLIYNSVKQEYTFFDSDIKEINGKKYVNGLDVTQYYDSSDEWADVPKQVVDEYNKQIDDASSTENDISTVNQKQMDNDKLINIEDLNYDASKGMYYVEVNKLIPTPEGLGIKELKADNISEGKGWFSENSISEYNDKIIQTQKVNESKINNKYINAMDNTLNPVKIGDEVYIEDIATGKRYVYDEDGTYEKRQDDKQYNVQYSENETDSTEHWGRHGHQIINGLIYRVKRVDHDTGRIKQDYSYYAPQMDKLTPLYNRMQDLAVKRYVTGEIGATEYNREHKKILAEAKPIIDSCKEDYRKTRLDVDDVKEAMWEIFDMDTAIEKSPDLLQDTFFVRFGHFNKEWCEKGKKVIFDGYTSTTYESGSASHFEEKMDENPNRWAILIMAEKGSNGVRLNNQFNALTTEREWMLARRQGFEVVDFDEENRVAVIKLLKH